MLRRVAPARERGLKSYVAECINRHYKRRSREGAWIEIFRPARYQPELQVAPARERGLKFKQSTKNIWIKLSLPRGSED